MRTDFVLEFIRTDFALKLKLLGRVLMLAPRAGAHAGLKDDRPPYGRAW